MRHLNKKQTRLLDAWILNNKDKITICTDVETCDFFSGQFFQELCNINDFEIITQCINRYINDNFDKELKNEL